MFFFQYFTYHKNIPEQSLVKFIKKKKKMNSYYVKKRNISYPTDK